MDTFFLNELKMCCAEINSDRENEDGISRVVDACKRAISFSEMVVNEGMIALDAACDDLDEDDITQKFLHIEVHLYRRIYQHKHRLTVRALLNLIHTPHSFFVGGVTTYSPNGVGGIQNDSAFVHHLTGFFNIFYHFLVYKYSD